MTKIVNTDKLRDTLGELEAALEAWDNPAPSSPEKEPSSEPVYEKDLLRKLYRQLQELSKD